MSDDPVRDDVAAYRYARRHITRLGQNLAEFLCEEDPMLSRERALDVSYWLMEKCIHYGWRYEERHSEEVEK